MAFCNLCGAQIADGTTTCVACSSRPPAPVAASGAGMADNVAGMLAYVTIIPAIIFLVIEPYNKSRFVRFHSFQSVFLFVGAFALHVALSIIAVVPLMIFLTAPLHMLVFLGTIVLAVVLAIKANSGQMYKLPVIGDLAEKQANTI